MTVLLTLLLLLIYEMFSYYLHFEVVNTIKGTYYEFHNIKCGPTPLIGILPDNVESVAVWYSTKGHEGSLTAPPQDVHVVHGSNMTSLKVALPDSSDPCQPYYIWVAGFVSNGQRGPYSKRRRVEVCSRTDGIFDPLERSNSIQQMNSTMLSHWEPLVDWHMTVVIVFAAVRIVFGVMVWRYQGKDKSNEGKVRVCLG